MLDLQEAVRLQSCQMCYNRLPSVASKKSNRAWRSDASWQKKVNVLQIIPLTLCRCTGISFFLWIFQCKKRDGCNFGSIFWASYDFGKRSRGSVWLPQPLQSFISESNRSCTFFYVWLVYPDQLPYNVRERWHVRLGETTGSIGSGITWCQRLAIVSRHSIRVEIVDIYLCSGEL